MCPNYNLIIPVSYQKYDFTDEDKVEKSCCFHAVHQLPEKVHFTIQLPIPGEALFGEVAVTVTALDALRVPGSVQYIQEESVQNGPFTAGTLDHHVSGLQDAECRPSHADCAARTEATRVYAEHRLDSWK